MDVLLSFGNWLLPLVYLALVIDYGATFFLRARTHVRSPWIILAIALHVVFLALRGIHIGRPPLATNPEVLSVVALSSAAVYWVTELASRDRRAGVFVFLLIFLCQYTSSAFQIGSPPAPQVLGLDVQSGWGRVHVLPAALAYTALALAAVYALLYLVGRRSLKQHRFGLLFDRLPSLERLGTMSWYALLAGFVFMTVTIATGAMVFARGAQPGQRLVLEPKVASKIIAGSAAWLICALAVVGKLLGRWPASVVSRVAVVGFLVVVGLLVTSMVLS